MVARFTARLHSNMTYCNSTLQPVIITPPQRLLAIDALRGLVILIMLLDHVREYFYLHKQVTDPIQIEDVEPALFFGRLAAHLCPTVFVFLAGVAAYLYSQRYQLSRKALSSYLLKRGLLLVALEVSVINFAWTFTFPPDKVYLQVIWAIGLSMMILAGLIWVRRDVFLALAITLCVGHNLLAPIQFSANDMGYIPWAILHDRTWINLSDSIKIRTSYPVLPWIGVIMLGYLAGAWVQKRKPWPYERKTLLMTGMAGLVIFFVLRYGNYYGEFHPRVLGNTTLLSVMSFLNITKYPPSLHYLLLTGSIGFLLYAGFRSLERKMPVYLNYLVIFGRAPMFFYVLHLFVLHVFYCVTLYLYGPNVGPRFGFPTYVYNIWLTVGLIIPFYWSCHKFLSYKHNHRYRWLSYL